MPENWKRRCVLAWSWRTQSGIISCSPTNGLDSGDNWGETRERTELMKQGGKVREALEKAIRQADEKSARIEPAQTSESSSKADAAIQKLRKDRRLTREELDRPVTI